MEPQIDAAAESSPADDGAASQTADADLLSEMRAFAGEGAKAEPSASKAKAQRKEAAKPDPAEAGDEEAAATDDAGPTEGKDGKAKPEDEGKPVSFRTFKARVDKLSAQRREAEERADKAEMQVERLRKAVEILQQEHQRFAPTAKLDPRDEELRAMKLEQEVARFNAELEQTWTAKRQKAVETAQVEERVQAIIADAKAAAEQHGVDARHVLQVMQVSGDSPQEIARRLAAAAATAPTKPSKPAPKAVTRSGQTAGNEYVGSDDYPTSKHLADYLRSLDG